MWRYHKDPTGQNTLQTSDGSDEDRLGSVLATTDPIIAGPNSSQAEINRLKKELTELRNNLQQKDQQLQSPIKEAELTKEGTSKSNKVL